MKRIKENLALEFAAVTDAAAIESAKWIGKGDGKAADKAAVDAMRDRFNRIDFRGEIVIGEGAKDEAPELYNGEKVGKGKAVCFDIAVDPLECTNSVAFGRPNAMSVIAVGPRRSLYRAADSYMEKIAVGPDAAHVIDLDVSVKENIGNIAKALKKEISEITVAVLDRPRHNNLIEEIRKTDARIQLFTDGDVAMAIATCLAESPVDVLMGVGGSTEAVLAAAALKCFGGELLCRWKPKEDHIPRLHAVGITDFDKIFKVEDLAKGDGISFTATGVISGPLLEGVVFKQNVIITHSMVITSSPKKVIFIKTYHYI
ncbi:MAG: class II fructose-bisphosphatase [Patescibacteria group bacterium]